MHLRADAPPDGHPIAVGPAVRENGIVDLPVVAPDDRQAAAGATPLTGLVVAPPAEGAHGPGPHAG